MPHNGRSSSCHLQLPDPGQALGTHSSGVPLNISGAGIALVSAPWGIRNGPATSGGVGNQPRIRPHHRVVPGRTGLLASVQSNRHSPYPRTVCLLHAGFFILEMGEASEWVRPGVITLGWLCVESSGQGHPHRDPLQEGRSGLGQAFLCSGGRYSRPRCLKTSSSDETRKKLFCNRRQKCPGAG